MPTRIPGIERIQKGIPKMMILYRVVDTELSHYPEESGGMDGYKSQVYDAEFKRNPVHLEKKSGKPISEIAEELRIEADLVYQWRRELNSGDALLPDTGNRA